MPHCLGVIGAADILAPEALEIIYGWNLTVLTSHDISEPLNSKLKYVTKGPLNILGMQGNKTFIGLKHVHKLPMP